MVKANIGIIGLGTMGSALALNFAENEISVAVTNRETDWIADFLERAGPLAQRISGFETLSEFVSGIEVPRVIVMMIPSGQPVDTVMAELAPRLTSGDTVVDAGNADFHDTRRRTAEFHQGGLNFVGMGVSGGEEGARHGPSMMVGGSEDSWGRLRPMLEPVAAEFDGDPCVAHVGPDGAGHFVKTVHNGIEYADMQMIAEIYGLLRDGSGWQAGQIAAMFRDWQDGPLSSFLVEITARVLRATDPLTGKPMVDMIRDQAGQKGTGRWTVIEALKLGQSASAIEAAVGARSWSAAKSDRVAASHLLPSVGARVDFSEAALQQALFAGRMLAHWQGFEVLRAASGEYGWSLDLARIAEIWRAGCIIRSDLLNDLVPALRQAGDRPVYLGQGIGQLLASSLPGLRNVVASAAVSGLPVPALAASLAWYDSIRQATGSANLIQAQRDAFGRHGVERVDRPGLIRVDWG